MKPGVPVRDRGAADGGAGGDRRRGPHALGAPLLRRAIATGACAGDRRLGSASRTGAARSTLPHAGPAAASHQLDNAGIAIAALRAAGLGVPDAAFAGHRARRNGRRGCSASPAGWPRRLPPGWELWLDGGHNPGAGEALAGVPARLVRPAAAPVVGMKQSKDPQGFLRPLLPFAASADRGGRAGPASGAAGGGDHRRLRRPRPSRPDRRRRAAPRSPGAGPPARVLICGSLYLAGEVLKADAEGP